MYKYHVTLLPKHLLLDRKVKQFSPGILVIKIENYVTNKFTLIQYMVEQTICVELISGKKSCVEMTKGGI